MHEQSKAAKRRYGIGKFHSHYFVGKGIDVGAGQDGLVNYRHAFPGISSCDNWDMPQGDAQYLKTVKDETYDFLTSSHCLEHMVDPKIALENWIRVVKPGGYLIITIPDEDMYEQNVFPSKYNSDHKWSFTLNHNKPILHQNSVSVLGFLSSFNNVQVEKVELIDEFYYTEYSNHNIDQTMMPNTESAIEFILRKL